MNKEAPENFVSRSLRKMRVGARCTLTQHYPAVTVTVASVR